MDRTELLRYIQWQDWLAAGGGHFARVNVTFQPFAHTFFSLSDGTYINADTLMEPRTQEACKRERGIKSDW
jgi:hypothetical protein